MLCSFRQDNPASARATSTHQKLGRALYIQEKVHPKVLVDDLLRRTEADEKAADPQPDLFADFNGLADEAATNEFCQQDANLVEYSYWLVSSCEVTR